MSDDTTGPARSSSIQRRADRQTRHARLLRSALDRHDVSQAELGVVCGVAPSKVARWVDPDSLDRPAAHEIEAFPSDVAVDMLRELAAVHGYTLAQLPAARRALDDVGMLVAASKEHGEAVSAAAACITPGLEPSLDALVRLEREATEALETMAAIRERARLQIAARRAPRPRPVAVGSR